MWGLPLSVNGEEDHGADAFKFPVRHVRFPLAPEK